MTSIELKEWRQKQGITQGELARRLNMSENAVGQWERGERSIPGVVPVALRTVERELKDK